MLLLPAVSVVAFALAMIAYPPDLFYTILCLALFPAVAGGLSALLRLGAPLQRGVVTTLALLAVLNMWWATFTWHALTGAFEHQAERHALAHVPPGEKVSLFSTFPQNLGSTRLEWLGYRHDPRSVQQMAAQRTDLPAWIYASNGQLQFLEDARRLPKRAAMLRQESGFAVNDWRGIEGLGYRLEETIVPRPPRWFPFAWMPAVKEWQMRKALLVYQKLER
jgi:hypothetical protein